MRLPLGCIRFGWLTLLGGGCRLFAVGQFAFLAATPSPTAASTTPAAPPFAVFPGALLGGASFFRGRSR
ncbi:MAG: hypothetical protein AMXMBFR13_16040 [Phycisphaerae bacterium]